MLEFEGKNLWNLGHNIPQILSFSKFGDFFEKSLEFFGEKNHWNLGI